MAFNTILIALFIINSIDHLIATRTVFAQSVGGSGQLRSTMVLLTLGSAVLVVLSASSGPISIVSFILALLCMLASSSIFYLSKKTLGFQKLTPIYSTNPPDFLLNKGPYKYIRHPFYSAYLLNYLGIALGSNNLLSFFIFLGIYFLYLRAAKQEEGKFLSSALCGEYLKYQAATGRFSPKITKGILNKPQS